MNSKYADERTIQSDQEVAHTLTTRDRLIQKGEELGNGIAAVATLLKVADQSRLEHLEEGGSLPESLGFLVEILGAEVFNAADDLRRLP